MNQPSASAAPTRTLRPRSGPPALISIVVPCFNEEEVIRETARRISAAACATGLPYEVIFVDDGSRDTTWPILLELRSADSRLKGVRLSRNFGHQIALTCGLDYSKGEVVVVMDADLQDPPELLGEMLRKWQEGYDVVYGKRLKRQGESIFKRGFAFAFYRIFKFLTGFDLPADTGDFRLMDRRAVTAFQRMREKQRFIRGMVSWLGFNQTPVFYDRPERFAGVTKYPFRKSLFLALDAITSFSYAPVRIASLLGVFFSGLAFVYIGIVIVLFLLGISWSGYTSIMAAVLLLGGIQLIVLGIMGEYIGRIFEQGQRRPLYLVDWVEGDADQKRMAEER